MIQRRSALLTLIAAGAAPTLGGCGRRVPGTVKIGVVVAQSGPFALRGKDLLRGAQMAVDELNAGAYKIGREAVTLELIHFDDKGEADGAAQGVTQLTGEGAVAIIGPINTPQGVKAIPAMAQTGRPHFFTITAANAHGHGKGNTFRLLGNDDLQGRAVASLVSDTVRGQRVVVIYESGDYGKGLNSVFATAHAAAGGKVLESVPLDAKAEVTAELAARIKAANADTVVLLSREPHLRGLFKTLQDVGHADRVTVVGTNVIRNRNVAALPIPVKALWATATALDPEEFTNGRAFVARFESKFKERPVWGAHYAYDAVFALADAMNRAESVQPADLVAQLKKAEPRTRVNQQMRFDAEGEQKFAIIAAYKAERGVWTHQMSSSVW